jgi:hypothetical protein
MSEVDPRIPAAKPASQGARISNLSIIAIIAVVAVLGLFALSTLRTPTVSGENKAPSLTTGAATSTPNNSGVTPPASR